MKKEFYFTKMSKLYIVVLTVMLMSCSKTSKYEVENYFSTNNPVDSFMIKKLMPYVMELPPADYDTNRFDRRFEAHFIRNLPLLPLKRYFIDKDSTHYYLVWKQAASIEGKQSIAIGGRFKLDKAGRISEFLETFNSYKMFPEELEKRGDDLFIEMVERGSIDKYIGNPDYVEFPDKEGKVYYDIKSSKWKLKAK